MIRLMLRNRRLALTNVTVVVAALAICGSAGPARAACNAIPDAQAIFGEKTADGIAVPEGLPYRGAIGRIDTPIARAAVPAKKGGFRTDFVTVGADPTCGSPRLAGAGELPSPHDYAVLLMFPPGPGGTEQDTTVAIVLAQPDRHDAIREQAMAAGDALTLLGVRSNAGVSVVPVNVDEGDVRLRIEYPDVADISFDRRTPITGPARIIVTRAADPIPFAKTLQQCTAIAADDSFRPIICIDELFFDAIDRCGTSPSGLHPGACHFVGGGKRMNFADHCFPGTGAAFHPAKCHGAPTGLEYLVARCGAVVLEFDWRDILAAGEGLTKRRLRGSTAISRSGAAGAGRVVIPGPEFLASLPTKSGNDGDPHLPDFEPAPTPPDGKLLVLEGSTDKEESTLFLYPRMMVGRVCEDGPRAGQACAGIENNQPACTCDLPGGADCDCRFLHPRDASYFRCQGSSERDGLPCTRASHCWSDGSTAGECVAESICVPPGTVWTPGAELEGEECRTDKNCSHGKQCGYSLFNFIGRDDHSKRTIAFLIEPGSKQRGVCERLQTKACGGDAGECTAREGRCIGYWLEAQYRGDQDGMNDPNFPSSLFDNSVPPGIVIGPDGVPDEAYGEFKALERSVREEQY